MAGFLPETFTVLCPATVTIDWKARTPSDKVSVGQTLFQRLPPLPRAPQLWHSAPFFGLFRLKHP